MATIIKRDDVPAHLFSVRELDFSDDLFTEALAGPSIRLAAHTITSRCNERGVQEDLFRQTLLLSTDGFTAVFDHLESVGNAIGRLGSPVRSVRNGCGADEYTYAAFHRFEFPFTPVIGEPLVFLRSNTSAAQLFINPDLWMFLELEEKVPGSGIWWDPRRGVEALVWRVIDEGSREIVEIRVEYLLKYLRARQMSLLVGHYRQLLLFNPPQGAIDAFVKEDVALGSAEHGAKAILQNWGLGSDVTGRRKYLQRRLHLWFEIRPPDIDTDDPWFEKPPFDVHAFTLPTRNGAVAPARWARFWPVEQPRFDGEICNFMDRIYFRQDVLIKYEGASGFEVKDDGSVSCRDYWGLVRSTARIGNELLSTAIGDFAEGVPFEEWPHWKQYAVEPPSPEMSKALVDELTIPEMVNSVVDALEELNVAFAGLASALGTPIEVAAWRGSLDSLAGRQLKWVYPATAGDDEFLKRATLASTLFLDGFQPASLRSVLTAVGQNLHQSFEKHPQSLGQRKLLQRLTLMALLIADLQPDLSEIPMLIQRAESNAPDAVQTDLQGELKRSYELIRSEFAPLAFLYDLRTHGGLAHPPDREGVANAAAKLNLPRGNWRRTDYLHLLNLIARSVFRISERLAACARAASGAPWHPS